MSHLTHMNCPWSMWPVSHIRGHDPCRARRRPACPRNLYHLIFFLPLQIVAPLFDTVVFSCPKYKLSCHELHLSSRSQVSHIHQKRDTVVFSCPKYKHKLYLSWTAMSLKYWDRKWGLFNIGTEKMRKWGLASCCTYHETCIFTVDPVYSLSATRQTTQYIHCHTVNMTYSEYDSEYEYTGFGVSHIFFERNPFPPRGGFLFTMFPHQEL